MADALKIFNKQSNFLINFNFLTYYGRVLSFISVSFILWLVAPLEPTPFYTSNSILFMFFFLSFNSITLIIMGWRSYGKYSVIASLRIVSQIISYEAVIYMVLFFFVFLYISLDLYCILNISFYLFPLLTMVWTVGILAEISRSPADFSERERELVRGVNLDYCSNRFSIIFISEYSRIVFFSVLTSMIFFSYPLFIFFLFFFIWIRGVLPRYRYDYFMYLCWKFLIPVVTAYFLLYIVFLI